MGNCCSEPQASVKENKRTVEDQGRQDICMKIAQKLLEIEVARAPDQQVIITQQLFILLTTREGQLLVKNYPIFAQVTKNKLHQFIEKEGYTVFIPYYAEIFGEPYLR